MRYDFADLSLDTDVRQLRRGRLALHLSPKALELLSILIAERRRAVPKQELYDRLWPATYVVDANLPVLIREIRTAIGDKKHEIIRTVHGTGYSFAAPVHEVAAPRGDESGEGFVHVVLFDNHQYRLNEGENFVGREPTAEVFLPSASVSRRHALISVRGAEATLVDLSSKNGTFIGAEPLRNEALLVDGNIIRFGEVIVRYRCCSADSATDTFADFA
jgi:DNA-binding winged helix-turn-helix (wHTH) protein